jgi:hypothetical protein
MRRRARAAAATAKGEFESVVLKDIAIEKGLAG